MSTYSSIKRFRTPVICLQASLKNIPYKIIRHIINVSSHKISTLTIEHVTPWKQLVGYTEKMRENNKWERNIN